MFGKPPLFSGEKKEVLAKCLSNARFTGPDRGAVAPFTGAWIETTDDDPISKIAWVAPFTGAWIETDIKNAFTTELNKSHPSRGRGLKHWIMKYMVLQKTPSHPSRGRGLKQSENKIIIKTHAVAPFTGAWIETTEKR